MSEANNKEELMNHQTITGTCSVCDRKDVPVRHFETCAATSGGILICLECQPPEKGRDGSGLGLGCFRLRTIEQVTADLDGVWIFA